MGGAERPEVPGEQDVPVPLGLAPLLLLGCTLCPLELLLPGHRAGGTPGSGTVAAAHGEGALPFPFVLFHFKMK